jgi:hypothetical protein
MVKRIFNLCKGHPAVVQYICGRLIGLINTQNRRFIRPDDVDRVTKNDDFVKKEFLNLYWEKALNLEKIITIVMANRSEPFDLAEVQKGLQDISLTPPAHDVTAALENLVELRNIFLRDNWSYSFGVPMFRKKLQRRQLNIQDEPLAEFLSEYQNGKP